MIRAVLDTNVIRSGIVGVERAASTPGAIIRAWRAQGFELVISEHIRAEVARNLIEHPYFSSCLTADQVATNLEALVADATQAAVSRQVTGVATHPEDDLVLAAAVSAGVEFLVSGDRQFLALGAYEGVTILSPRAFLTALELTVDVPVEDDAGDEGGEVDSDSHPRRR